MLTALSVCGSIGLSPPATPVCTAVPYPRNRLYCASAMAKRPPRMSSHDFQQRKGFYVQGQASQAQQVDKAILTLASGAFGVSLAFIRDIAGDDVRGVWLLATSWAALLASVASVLVSLRFGADAHAFEDAELEKQRCDPTYQLAENVCGKRVRPLNWAALALLISGAVLLSLFALANITR